MRSKIKLHAYDIRMVCEPWHGNYMYEEIRKGGGNHMQVYYTCFKMKFNFLFVLFPALKDIGMCKLKWAASWRNQQSGMCAQHRLRSAWASAQSDQSSLSAWRKLGSLATHWAHSEDSDQTERMPRLIWVFAGHTCHFLGFVMRWLKCYILLSQ